MAFLMERWPEGTLDGRVASVPGCNAGEDLRADGD